jgi:hypothetical protein
MLLVVSCKDVIGAVRFQQFMLRESLGRMSAAVREVDKPIF